MKTLIIAFLIISLSACTTYDIRRDSEGIISVKVKSTRSFEAPDLHYERIGSDVTFDFEAANADNNTEQIMGAMGSMVQFLQQMMLKMAAPTP
jgi:hypothetical protein